MPRPKLTDNARAQLLSKGFDDEVISALPDSSVVHYNSMYKKQRGSFDQRNPIPRAPVVPTTVPERLQFTGTEAAEDAFIAAEFGISPERGQRAQQAAEDFTAVQRTPGGTAAPILSRLQQPFSGTQFAQDVTGTARGEIPAEGLAGLLGALAPQTMQTRQQMDEAQRQGLNANKAALMQMRILYPDLTDEERVASTVYDRLSRDILTGKRSATGLAALQAPELVPTTNRRLIKQEAARLSQELMRPKESPLGGIIEPPAAYAGRILSAPVSGAVGVGEAILTSTPTELPGALTRTIPERIQAGESVTGAGRDIGAVAARLTGVEALEPIGTGLGFVSEFIVNPIPGSGVARAVTRTGTAATRAAIAGGVRAGADVAATQVIGRVSPTYALRRAEASPQIAEAIEQAGNMARAYRGVEYPELSAAISRRLTAAGVANADDTAAELVSKVREIGGTPTAAQTKTIARQLAQRAITRPGAETVRITPTTAAPEDIAAVILQEYRYGTNAGRLATTIQENPQKYISEHRGRPIVDVRRAAEDAGLTEPELIDILQSAARRRYDIAEADLITPAAEPARLATMFSGMGTVEAGLTAGTARSVDAVEYMPDIMEQFNRVHGTGYVPRSVIDIDVADVAAANPEVFHASPVCKNFSAAKRGVDNADELDRLSAEKVAEVIREVRPPIVTVENVADYKDTALFKLITDQLTASGYKWSADIVEAAEYGAAQERRRLILRAVRDDIGELPPAPEKTGGADWYATLEDLIADAPDMPGARKPAPEPTPPPVFRKSDYELTDVTAKEAGEFLERNHYAGGAGRQGKYIIGLRNKDGELKGIAWWNPPGGGANVKRWAARQFVDAQGNPIHPDEVINLSRLAISPDVPRNAASYLLQRSIKRIRANSQQRRKAGQRPYRVALTYADQREGHTGFIYKLTGWTYTGESAKHSKWIDPATGRQVSTQATKNRNNAQMYAAGYKKQAGMRKHRYVLPIDRGLKYTGKETPPPAETPRAAPAAPAAPTVPPILRNAPDWERRRLMAMAERGTIDLNKPILSMGGSTSRTNVSARNAGQPAPTLKSTPKESPRIYLPDGTAKRLTPRMMARLTGLPDSVPVPDTGTIAAQTRKAKTVLGNGIEGNITRKWIEPLYSVLRGSKEAPSRQARDLIGASVERDLQGMSLPRYNAAAVSALDSYALANGAEDLTAIQAADPTAGQRLRRALTPRELRPGKVRTLINRATADQDETMTPGLEKLIDATGRELGTMGDDLLRATRARERAEGISRPEAFIIEVVSEGYGGNSRRATREAMYGLYGAFDSVGQAIYGSRASTFVDARPEMLRENIGRIMNALADYAGDDDLLIELRNLLSKMGTSAEAYGLGALQLPRILAGTSVKDLATRLNLSDTARMSSKAPLFKEAAGLDLIGLTYSQARTGRILSEALTPSKLRAAGISYNPQAPGMLLNDTAAAMGGTAQDAATIYNAVLAEMAGTSAVRLNLLDVDTASRIRTQLASTEEGRAILQRYDDAELTELLLSAGHRLAPFQTAARPGFEDLKLFIEQTLADRIQPIAQLEAAGVKDAEQKIKRLLNLEGVSEMLKRVNKPEEQRLLKLTGELIDIYDLAIAGDVAGLAGKANLRTSGRIIQAATQASLHGGLSLLDANSPMSRWVKGGLLAGRFLPNLVYMGMNVLTAPAIVFSTIGPGAAARAAARMATAPATTAIAGAAGLEAANRLTRLSPTIASLNAFYGYGDPLRVILTTPAGEVYRAADIAELIPRITTQAQAELAESLASDFRTYSGIAERAVMRGQPTERISELSQSRGRRAFRAYTGLDPATGEVGQNIFNEMADAQDLTFRVGVMIDALQAGRPVDEALTLAQDALFDYGRMTDWERQTIAKRVWFWTFRRENLRAAALNLVENPERMRAAYQGTGILQGYDDNPSPVAADYMSVRPFIKLFEDTELQRRFATYGPSAPMMDAMAEMIDYATAGAMLIDGTLYALFDTEAIPGQLRTATTDSGRASEVATRLTTGAAEFAVEERINPFISGAMELGMGIQGNAEGESLTDYLDPRFLAYMDLNPDSAEIFGMAVDIEPIPYADEIPGNGHYAGRQWRVKANPFNLARWSLIRHAMILGGFERTIRDYAPIYHRMTREEGAAPAPMQLEPQISESLPPELDLFFRSIGVASPVKVLTREERRRRNMADMSQELRAAGLTERATPAEPMKKKE